MGISKEKAWHIFLQLSSCLSKNNPKPYKAAKLDKWSLVEVEIMAEKLDKKGHCRVQFSGIVALD